jgi:hypothetical protein
MGYVKEPKGIYLVIPPSKLTQQEADEISDFIQKDKLKNNTAKAKMTSEALKTIKEYDTDRS